MADNTFFREQTAEEKTDFVNVMKSKNPKSDKSMAILSQFNKKNRYIISNSKDPLKDINRLSCGFCFVAEFKNNMCIDDFRKNWIDYQGRLKLKGIAFHNIKNKHSDTFNRAISLQFHQCEYCKKNQSIMFSDYELDKKIFDKLVKSAQLVDARDDNTDDIGGSWDVEKEETEETDK